MDYLNVVLAFEKNGEYYFQDVQNYFVIKKGIEETNKLYVIGIKPLNQKFRKLNQEEILKAQELGLVVC